MPTRDWAWPWEPSYGPLVLTVTLEVSPAALMARLPTSPYRYEGGDGVWRSDLNVERDARLVVGPSSVQWLRSWVEPSVAQRAFDAALLLELAQGAFGAVSWWLVDEDYVEPLAGGPDAASLRRHLSSSEPETSLRAHYQRWFAPVEVDVSSAPDVETGLETVALALGAPLEARRGEAFQVWLVRHGLNATRRLSLTLPRGTSADPWRAALASASFMLRFTWAR